MNNQRQVLITLKEDERGPGRGFARIELGPRGARVDISARLPQGNYEAFIQGERVLRVPMVQGLNGTYVARHAVELRDVFSVLVAEVSAGPRFRLHGVRAGARVDIARLKAELRIMCMPQPKPAGSGAPLPKPAQPKAPLKPPQKELPGQELTPAQSAPHPGRPKAATEQRSGSRTQNRVRRYHSGVYNRPQKEEPEQGDSKSEKISDESTDICDNQNGSGALREILTRASELFPNYENKALRIKPTDVEPQRGTPPDLEPSSWDLEVEDVFKAKPRRHAVNPLERALRQRPTYKQRIQNPFSRGFDGQWNMVRYPGMSANEHYLAANIRLNGRPTRILAVPGKFSHNPPAWLNGFGRYMASRMGGGYWLLALDDAGAPVRVL